MSSAGHNHEGRQSGWLARHSLGDYVCACFNTVLAREGWRHQPACFARRRLHPTRTRRLLATAAPSQTQFDNLRHSARQIPLGCASRCIIVIRHGCTISPGRGPPGRWPTLPAFSSQRQAGCRLEKQYCSTTVLLVEGGIREARAPAVKGVALHTPWASGCVRKVAASGEQSQRPTGSSAPAHPSLWQRSAADRSRRRRAASVSIRRYVFRRGGGWPAVVLRCRVPQLGTAQSGLSASGHGARLAGGGAGRGMRRRRRAF